MKQSELSEHDKRETILLLIKCMEETGGPPEYVYAAKKTGIIVLEDNVDAFTFSQVDEWNAAVEEYLLLQTGPS